LEACDNLLKAPTCTGLLLRIANCVSMVRDCEIPEVRTSRSDAFSVREPLAGSTWSVAER
jgi:hypothetical protein